MKRYPELGSGLTLNDANGGVLDVRARHRRDIGDPLACIEKQRKDGALARRGRPMPLIGGDFIVRPGVESANFLILSVDRVEGNPDIIRSLWNATKAKNTGTLTATCTKRFSR